VPPTNPDPPGHTKRRLDSRYLYAPNVPSPADASQWDHARALLLRCFVRPRPRAGRFKTVTRDVDVPMTNGVRIAVTLGLPSADRNACTPGKSR